MLRFLPWKYIVRRAARAYGFADPALWLARIRNFARPSEVQEPIELVRAGVLFHARGIVNARAIQHNLDWVWPYWVERQFDPEDISFIPRAFSLSHINLTHRNWTAIGLPELAIYPIVDPRGLVTPLHDGWSIDCWLFDAAGHALVPSRLHDESVRQQLVTDSRHAVVTSACVGEMALEQAAHVTVCDGQPSLEIDLRAFSAAGGSLVVALRPYNPEGVQFIDEIEAREGGGWRVNARTEVIVDRPADRMLMSDYESGDVFTRLNAEGDKERGRVGEGEMSVQTERSLSPPLPVSPSRSAAPLATSPETSPRVRCAVGMATAAAVYRFDGPRTELAIRVPLAKELAAMASPARFDAAVTWPRIRSEAAELRVPDERMQSLYDAAVHTLVLLSADEIVPGPYTYRRFWFRDACLMMNSLLGIGLAERCRRGIERFGQRQLKNGYFRSQEGEWDSNGQVLWIMDRYESLSGKPLPESLRDSIDAAVRWIDRKRVRTSDDSLHNGLLPAGFSAEHLGPNDHYYWDDFWAASGLAAAARMFHRRGRTDDAANAGRLADEMRRAIERSIERIPQSRSQGGIPASPYRRLDAGAIGSLVADYPLQFYPPGESRIMATVEVLLRNYFHKGGFFQDIIHSGINAYLTLDVAQTLLRAGDARYRDLVETVARLATATGQWPEAIHPQTLGGCMGDGQHGWAAAEWVMMIRNAFVREEGERLVVGSGLFSEWFDTDDELRFGPTLTPWGPVTVRLTTPLSKPTLTIDGGWRGNRPRIDIAIPIFGCVADTDASLAISLKRKSADFAEVRR
ncbi:MAG: hypothetical protein WD738_02060 [Pirellulales bacterium]